jgi:hypothetical protein
MGNGIGFNFTKMNSHYFNLGIVNSYSSFSSVWNPFNLPRKECISSNLRMPFDEEGMNS